MIIETQFMQISLSLNQNLIIKNIMHNHTGSLITSSIGTRIVAGCIL